MVLLRSALTNDEMTMVKRMQSRIHANRRHDDRLRAYELGSVRIQQLGLAVPPDLWMLETLVNWPRVHVNEHVNRMQIRSIMRPGSQVADQALMEGFQANNIDSEASIQHRQTLVLGRGYVSVGTNEDDPEHPLILIESPEEMECLIDNRRRRMDAALRMFQSDTGDTLGTLLLPDRTLQLILGSHGWQLDEVGSDLAIDEHDLGRVPVVKFLNRRRAGDWAGESEMTDIIPITDAACRALTDLQFAVETTAVPTKYALGVKKEDFVDKDGRLIPAWEAYYNRVWSTANQEAKLGTFQSADLRNFHETIGLYGELAASVTGLPIRYFGKNTANPAAEGAIRADESRLIKNAENMMATAGDCWAWVAALYERFRTGAWLAANQVQVEWHDAATPTKAQQADAIAKLNGGVPVLSREGSWDEMGWSVGRKDRERAYFAEEAADQPFLEQLNKTINPPTDGSAA